MRLPASFYPRVVTVTDSTCAPGECNRIHRAAAEAHGPTVLPELLEVDLLVTERPDKQVFVTPEPELEAE